MYEINSEKRYNVTYVTGGGFDYQINNVQLKVLKKDFVICIDRNGKEHILTGALGIYITEV